MPKKLTNDNPIELEKQSQREAEAMSFHHGEGSVDTSGGNLDEEAEKGLTVEEGADADEITPASAKILFPSTRIARFAALMMRPGNP